jgi:hypothetical protein
MENKILCKLTNQELQTYNNTQWAINEWQIAAGEGELCSEGWLHGYEHPLLAVLLNPIHANIENPRLFAIEVGEKIKEDEGLKFGSNKMRLIKELELPQVSLEQRIKFGILCALEVCDNAAFVTWATGWLSGADRSQKAAADGAAWAAAYYAAADAAWAAVNTATAAAAAASAAAWAAADASKGEKIDLIAIAMKAVS